MLFDNRRVLTLLLATACFFSSLTLGFKQIEGTQSKIIPGRFIVSVSTSSTNLGKRANEVIASVIDNINDQGIEATTQKTYEAPGLLTGASIVVPVNTTVADLLAVPGVAKVWPVRSVPRPRTFLTSDGDGQTTNSEIKSSLEHLSRRSGLERRTSAYKSDAWSPHAMTGVSAMHQKGFLGSGIRVAVIDSGVDYKNPILGGCFGKGCKVGFGYAFVGDYDESTSSDPYTNCSEHGTHVSGIIGANANSYGFTGVAPEATLGMYRVFSCSGNSAEDVIVEALLRAVTDKADVINMSLGGAVGWLDGSPTQALVEKLNAKGIVTAVSAGNDQAEGMFFAEFPSATRTGIAVASVDVVSLPAYNMNFKSGGYAPLPYLSPTPFSTTTTFSVYFTSTDSTITNDACNPLPSSTPDLADRLVIMQRGGCNFVTKMAYAAEKGARFAMIYNSATGSTMPYLSATNTGLMAVAGLRRQDGLLLLKYYNAQKKNGPKVAFPSNSRLVPGVLDTVSGGQVSDFSTFGPTNELYGQPSFSAPGGNILSTYPLALGGVGVLSGTSMAAPFAAGSVALLLSARKSEKLTPAQIRQLLSSTANSVPVKRNTASPLTTTLLQGGGLIQVDKAYSAKSFVFPNELMLNDTAHFNGTQFITITNKNSKAVTYRYVATNTQTRTTYDGPRRYNPSLKPPVLASSATVAFRPGRITIPAGETATVRITITPPVFSARELSMFPFYSGFISLTADDSLKQKFQIPYFGLAGNMSDMPILDQTSTYATNYQSGLVYPFISDGETVQTSARTVKTYPMSTGVTAYFRLSQATRAYNIDLVFANTTFRPTITSANNANLKRRSVASDEYASEFASLEVDVDPSEDSHILARASTLMTRAVQTYSSVSIVGRISDAQTQARDFAVDGSSSVGFSDRQVNFVGQYQTTPNSGAYSTATIGTPYRFLLRTLRTTADPKIEASWESWLSPPFQFSSS